MGRERGVDVKDEAGLAQGLSRTVMETRYTVSHQIHDD